MSTPDVNARLTAVESVGSGVRRFHASALQTAGAAAGTIRQVVDRIGAEHERRLSRLAAAERRTAAASAALAACEENCQGLQRALADAQQDETRWRGLTQASAKAMEMASSAASAFAGKQRAFSNDLQAHGPAAIIAADSYLEELRAYLAVSADAGAAQLGGSARGPSGVGAMPGGASVASVELARITGDRGDDELRFEKVSREQFEWGLDRLKSVVEPAVSMGKGPEYFADRDRSEGLSGERSYLGVYRWFYGDNAIKLSKRPDGALEIAGGYHRIYVAKQMNITSLPAVVR